MVSSALGGQTALLALPVRTSESLESFPLPVQLKISSANDRKKVTVGKGMDIIKVAANGKRQSRRVAISNDGYHLLVSSEKVSMRNLLRKRSKLGGESVDSFRKIDISSIDRIVRGQVTRKFLAKPKNANPLPDSPVKEERISLSIVFRINTAAAKLVAEEEDLTVTTDSTNSWGSLDLIIPSHNDYELLIRTLNSLMELHHHYKSTMSRDVLLLQQHWTDLGKNLSDRIHQGEWSTLCIDRLSVPVRKAAVVSLYKKFCTALNTRGDEGIPLSKAVGLLSHTRKLSLHMENKVDPCDVIWNILLQHNVNYESLPVYDSDGSEHSTIDVNSRSSKKKNGGTKESVTAVAFLKFLQAQQKDSKVTIQEVKHLFERLNSITTASQVADDGKSRKYESSESKFSSELITKAVFLNYILSDCNDAFDPARGKWENDDMTQPLCSYWINSSHDTYLCEVPPAVLNSKFDKDLDDCSLSVKMYANALYRGCRALDVDCWDGEHNLKGNPVVKLDSLSSKDEFRPPSAYRDNLPETKNEPIVFSEVLWLVRSFLLSNPDTLPVILCIEAHCSLTNQEKMAEDIKSILRFDDMVYLPKGFKTGDTLPSPEKMRGKVIFKFKVAGNSRLAAFDDYDEDIDINPNSESNDDFGIDTVGSDFDGDAFKNIEKSPKELEEEARKVYLETVAAAKAADDKAFEAKIKANRQKEIAQKMLKKANLTSNDAEYELRRKSGKPLPKKPTPTQPKNSWFSFMFGLKDEPTDAPLPEVASFEYTEGEEPSKISGFMTNVLEWGDSEYSSSYTSDEDSDEDSDHECSVDEAMSELGTNTMNQAGQKKQRLLNHKDNKPCTANTENSARNSQYSMPGTHSNNCDDDDDDDDEQAAEKKHYSNSNVQMIEEQLRQLNVRTHDGSNISNAEDRALIDHSEAERKHAKACEIVHFASKALATCEEEVHKANKELMEAKHVAEAIQERRYKELTAEKLKSKSAREKMENVDDRFDKASIDVKRNNQVAQELKEKLEAQSNALDEYHDKLLTAKAARETAASEADFSEVKAVEAEGRAKAAQAEAAQAAATALEEAVLKEEAEKKVIVEEKVCNEVNKHANAAKQKWQVISDGFERVKRQIRDIERSAAYRKEMKDMERGNLEDGKMRRQHKMKSDEKYGIEGKLQKAAHDKRIAEEKKAEAENYLDEALKHCNERRRIAAKAIEAADNAANLAEQLDETANEDREAANMRETANTKATATVKALEHKVKETKALLRELEHQYEKANHKAMDSELRLREVANEADRVRIDFENQIAVQKDIEKMVKVVPTDFDGSMHNVSGTNIPEHETVTKLLVKLEKKRDQMKSTEKAYTEACEAQKRTEKELDDARSLLKQNEDVYYKSKIEATMIENRQTAKESMFNTAVDAYDRYKQLIKAAYAAKEEAVATNVLLEEKATTYQQSQEYAKKMSSVKPISSSLSEMTLLHSVKFQYFEKSNVLPFNNMHSLSEGRILDVHEEGDYEVKNLIHFNKTHMSRVFPSKHKIFRAHSNNYNPVLAWSLGCQMASMNQQICDAFVLVNDGRFRVNGSCGYVLKPESMIETKGVNLRLKTKELLPRQWTIKILSGYNLPKPRRKVLSGSINPRVRVTLYDSDHNKPPVVHLTETILKNGLNPIWDEKDGTQFKVKDPNTAVILFSLWDNHNYDTASEDFIAAAAIPISCMREGYRSIPLFDANNMRCGAHGHSMLLARIDAK